MASFIEVSCEEYGKLWQMLQDDNPKINKIAQQLELCSKKILKTQAYWEKNKGIDVYNLPVKKTYADYISFILDKKPEGMKLYLEYQEHLKKYFKVNQFKVGIDQMMNQAQNYNSYSKYRTLLETDQARAILEFNHSKKLHI